MRVVFRKEVSRAVQVNASWSDPSMLEDTGKEATTITCLCNPLSYSKQRYLRCTLKLQMAFET